MSTANRSLESAGTAGASSDPPAITDEKWSGTLSRKKGAVLLPQRLRNYTGNP